MATQDIRLKRIDDEYGSLRGARNRLPRLDCRELLLGNRELLMENREMLLAIIKHLEVPYEKPPMGFRRE